MLCKFHEFLYQPDTMDFAVDKIIANQHPFSPCGSNCIFPDVMSFPIFEY